MSMKHWSTDWWHDEFYQREKKRLSQIAKRLKLPADLIEDAVQEVLLRLARQEDSIRGAHAVRRLRALGRKILHDTATDLLRRRDRKRTASLNGVPDEPEDDKASNPVDRLTARELPEWVRTKLEELRQEQPQYAWLLSEHFLNERTIQELATEKGISMHALECQKTRAIKAFRRLLERHDSDGEFLR